MNRKEKSFLKHAAVVIALTTAAILALMYIKDRINRFEAKRVMELVARPIVTYSDTHLTLPPQSFVEDLLENLQGYARGTSIKYRGHWVEFDGPPDQIVAYNFTPCPHSFLPDGYTVLRLDGTITFMDAETFKSVLARQQTQAELDTLEALQPTAPLLQITP